jgi:hypothetical protein
MWKIVTRTSGRYGCRLDLSEFDVEPSPRVQDVPFDRVVLAAEKKRFRQSKGVSNSRLSVIAIRPLATATPQTTTIPELDSGGAPDSMREYSYFS